VERPQSIVQIYDVNYCSELQHISPNLSIKIKATKILIPKKSYKSFNKIKRCGRLRTKQTLFARRTKKRRKKKIQEIFYQNRKGYRKEIKDIVPK